MLVVLTFLSLLIAVDAKNRKKRAESAFTSAGSRLSIEGSANVGDSWAIDDCIGWAS